MATPTSSAETPVGAEEKHVSSELWRCGTQQRGGQLTCDAAVFGARLCSNCYSYTAAVVSGHWP